MWLKCLGCVLNLVNHLLRPKSENILDSSLSPHAITISSQVSNHFTIYPPNQKFNYLSALFCFFLFYSACLNLRDESLPLKLVNGTLFVHSIKPNKIHLLIVIYVPGTVQGTGAVSELERKVFGLDSACGLGRDRNDDV